MKANAQPDHETIARRVDFSHIRYAQCWEDAEVLMEGLDLSPGARCLSIASAGDNSLALLTKDPARVLAIDFNPAQLVCLELRVAAYRRLQHDELLELIGSRPSERRRKLYAECRGALGGEVRDFWDQRPDLIESGIGSAGKFERYFETFRRRVLPCIHGRKTVARLLEPKTPSQVREFYQGTWNTWRWRSLFRIFFSRTVMGWLGRDPRFFDQVEGPVAPRILERTRHALRDLDPAANPYLNWILTGRHGAALPAALREENFERIRRNLDRLEWRLASLEQVIGEPGGEKFDAWNLSDLFEYLSESQTAKLLKGIADRSNPGARLAYWNMLAPRSRPESLAHRLRPLDSLASDLHRRDRAFFYSRFVLEEVTDSLS